MLIFAGLVFGASVGCTTITPPQPKPAPNDIGAELSELTELARTAFDAEHLIEPEAGSAFALYQQMASLQPGNNIARRGIESIVERYLELAETAAAERRFAAARSMVARARYVDPTHPGIDSVTAQVRLLQTADRRALKLPPGQLSTRAPQLAIQLAEFGRAIRSSRCRSVIFSVRDADARWIYAQLSRGEGEGRIRADFEPGSPPRVETLCFTTSN